MVQKTTAVIPAYNEAQHIADVVSRTKKFVDNVIVVDDGSTDNTFSCAKDADLVLRHIVNMGKGLALKTGIEAAISNHADIIVVIDADGQHKPEDIPKLVKKLTSEGLDLVATVRPLNQNMPFVLRLGNWGITNLFYLLFNYHIPDCLSGFRAFRASVYPKIKWSSTGYSLEPEMLALAGLNYLKVGYLLIDTIYLNKVKGTTVIDGISIGFKMVSWKLKWWFTCL